MWKNVVLLVLSGVILGGMMVIVGISYVLKLFRCLCVVVIMCMCVLIMLMYVVVFICLLWWMCVVMCGLYCVLVCVSSE